VIGPLPAQERARRAVNSVYIDGQGVRGDRVGPAWTRRTARSAARSIRTGGGGGSGDYPGRRDKQQRRRRGAATAGDCRERTGRRAAQRAPRAAGAVDDVRAGPGLVAPPAARGAGAGAGLLNDAVPGQEMVTEVSRARPGARFVDFGSVHLLTTGALASRPGNSSALTCTPPGSDQVVLEAPHDRMPGQELTIGDVMLRARFGGCRGPAPRSAHAGPSRPSRSGYGNASGSRDGESARDPLDVLGSVLWCGDAQHGLAAVEHDGPGHERAALRLGGSERLKFFLNARPGLKPNFKLATGSQRSGRGTFAELFPATHAFGSIFQPERACDGESNTVRRAVGVHIVNSMRVTPPGKLRPSILVGGGSHCGTLALLCQRERPAHRFERRSCRTVVVVSPPPRKCPVKGDKRRRYLSPTRNQRRSPLPSAEYAGSAPQGVGVPWTDWA